MLEDDLHYVLEEKKLPPTDSYSIHMYLTWGFKNQNNNLVLDYLSVRFAWQY